MHEVIVDLQMAASAGLVALTANVPHALRDILGEPRLMMQMQVSGSSAEPRMAGGPSIGWEFRGDDGDTWIVRVRGQQVTCHSIRSQEWPSGKYVGWEAILSRFTEVHSRLVATFSEVPIQRAGLRYLNRIAVPFGKDLDDWFTLRFTPHPVGQTLRTFTLHQTWEGVKGFDDIAASVRFGRIDVPGTIAEEAAGVLLDIDLFNLHTRDAPAWSECPVWFDRTHEAENLVFENSITDKLRAIFDQPGGVNDAQSA